MATRADHSDHPNTLPLPELNPLLNPLLADNMGRWAEVYFRNPPENREQAVLELLQELEKENSARHHSLESSNWTSEHGLSPEPTAVPQASVPHTETPPSLETQPAHLENTQPTIRCHACAYVSDIDQRFCGMCGTPLRREDAAVVIPEVPIPENEVFEHTSSSSSPMPADFANEPLRGFQTVTEGDRQNSENYAHSDSLIRSLSFQSLDYEAKPRSYRSYIGAALAVVMLALGYIAWRSSQSAQGAGASPLAIQAPPPVATPRPEAIPAPIPAKVDVPEKSHNEVSTADTRPDAEQIPAKQSAQQIKPAAFVAKGASATISPALTTAGNGAEELAMARRYLDGTAGEKNNLEAIDWLWKAVAKRNAEATILLSDLYLRGNGIQKNCDQARVLLDAAASRGMKDAAMRLRNMQAFGCQ